MLFSDFRRAPNRGSTDFRKFHNFHKIAQFPSIPQSLPLTDHHNWSKVRKVQSLKKNIGCYKPETRATRFAVAQDKDEDRLWNFREIVEFPGKLWKLWNSTISAEASCLLLSFLKHMAGNQNLGPVIFLICVRRIPLILNIHSLSIVKRFKMYSKQMN